MPYRLMTTVGRAGFVVICMSFFAACSKPNDELPPELFKVWRSSAALYNKKYIEFRKDSVIFGTGKYSISMHPIERVEVLKSRGNTASYLIEYSDREQELYHLELSLRTGDRPELRLANHKEVWVPEPPQKEGA